MSQHLNIHLAGADYVIIERAEFDRLNRMAKAAELPALPKADAKGNLPARAYLRSTIARGIIRDRANAGLSQRKLADLAGVRFETLCRIETGKNTPDTETIEKIDRALKTAMKKAN